MHIRSRLIVQQPAGLPNDLSRAAQAAGAWALVDATTRDPSDQLRGLDPACVMLRTGLDAPVRPDVGMAILYTWCIAAADVQPLREAIQRWQRAGVPVAVEVRDAVEGRRARDAGADALVSRGCEGPGRASSRSNLVLLPALAELGLPLIAWGGAGPNATAALLVHAEGVVLGAQLYQLPEVGLSEAWQRALSAFDGTDLRALGQTVEEPVYLHARAADRHVHDLWEQEHASDEGPRTRRAWLQAEVQDLADWSTPPGEGLHALGHDAAHADHFAQFESLAQALDDLEARVHAQFQDFPLREGSPLARDHGTRLPVVQGAMANVSEVPAFARAVSDASALPFLAFAALRPAWAEETLTGTLEALDGAPFGCGIIGLDVNAEKRDAHVTLIKEHQPPLALIAAGTAEQALDLERAGVDTYLHTPSQGIVAQATELGLSRVVVEGNECGGHIGKLPSLVLWDLAFQALEDRSEVRVLLAGGIGDEHSAAMAGVLAAGKPHLRVGVLMGTAYLATREIVETGAIPPEYQRLVLSTDRTSVTGETVGIRARSAPTPFTQRVRDLEHELVREGAPLPERKQTLEHENLGATRIAARGLKRQDDGSYAEIAVEERLQDGNYLCGQAAERLDQVMSLDELHEAVTDHAHQRAQDARMRLDQPPRTLAQQEAPEEELDRAVAIVGLGCVLPDAPDVPTFWENLLQGRVSIRELPEGRWPVSSRAHLRDGPDGTYTVLGGFVDPDQVDFDPIRYRIPPKTVEQMDESQQWAVLAVEQALHDAGLTEATDRDRWAVVLGNAQGGEQRAWTDRRMVLRETEALLEAEDLDEAARERVRAVLERQRQALPAITEDTMPGELSNVIAGRVCHVFDIGGPARTVDAACASSLAAVEEAVALLREGAVDVAVTGGVDRSMDPAAYAKFSAIGALSKEGSFPFDQRASGFVMGEGCAVLVLKRLTDAVADGDRIYATIHGVGSSSDGRGKGITAPNPSGQTRAIGRALDDAGWTPDAITMVEAHGTGTPVGDPAEAETLETILDRVAPGSVALGSVKSNIGHLKAAAGAAGLLKATLAIHHGLQPPTVVETPTTKVDWTRSPLRLVTEPTPWTSGPRRAGVSAFGFGGTNSHVLLGQTPTGAGQPEVPDGKAPIALHRASAGSRQELLHVLDTDPTDWPWDPDAPVRLALSDQASPDDARAVLQGELPLELALTRGVCLAEGEARGRLALLFPGQGSQYPGMVLDLAEHFPVAREVLAAADQVLTPLLGRPLSAFLAMEGDEAEEALKQTEVCQPAVLTCDIAVLRVLEELGVEPDVVAGHSLGEYAALVAAGVLRFEHALHAVSARGREMAAVEVDDPGGLVALRASLDQVEPLLEGLEAWPANVNGPEQTVVAATTPALAAIQQRAEEAGVQASRLPVSAAFHSPLVAPATEPLARVLETIPVDPPRIPVISNTTGKPYPDDPARIRALLAEQVAAPVQWVETMDHLAQTGVELVVEAGPRRVLTGLSRSNLPEVPAVPTLHPRTGVRQSFAQALVALAAHGHPPAPEPEPSTPAPSPAPRPAAPSGPTASNERPSVVVTGVALGLPGGHDPFDPQGIEALLSGQNRIEAVPDHLRRRMASMGITRLEKEAPGGPRLAPVDDPDQVVRLSGATGPIDLHDYGVEEDWLDSADATARLGVAAALNALTDAHLPLVREQRSTSTGAVLEGGWVLPEPLQARTGIILASAFPGYDSLLEEAERGPGMEGASGVDGAALTGYLADLLPHLEEREAREQALSLLLEHGGSAQGRPRTDREEASEGFPRDFLFRALGMGHAQIAQLLRARGPNLHVNAACASTTAALALAQDWVEQDRCDRVIVVGADVAGNERLLPWVGAGFLAAGAASTSDRVDEAALPFDQRRHGMLIGSGAVALVVEREDQARDRGVTPLAELVDAHLANSAYHGARLDADHVADEVEAFLSRAAARLEQTPHQMAEELVFVSHEPATPARGGSAESEVQALRQALGEAAPEVLITNTKGLTGHAMGAGIEDGVAVSLLRHRRVPPVANLKRPDQAFQDLAFSQGEATDRSLSLRFAAGFGSQVAMALFRRTHPEPGSVDRARFQAWTDRVVGPDHRVESRQRLLRAVAAAQQSARTRHGPSPAPTPEPAQTASAERPPETVQLLRDLVSERTGYPVDVIDPAMDLEADLGVDTVKQAEVLAEARRRLDLPPIEGLSLADVPTLEAAARTLDAHRSDGTPAPLPTAKPPAAEPQGVPEARPRRADPDVLTLLRELVSERTGYPVDVIEPDMDLEADLGVDTVKQAEVLAEARKRLDIPPIEGLNLAAVPTLAKAAASLAQYVGSIPTDSTTRMETPGPLPAQENVSDPSPVRVLRLTSTEAPAAAFLPEGVRVAAAGELPTGLAEALTEAGAMMVEDDPALVVVPLRSEGPDGGLSLLEHLQTLPDDARAVVVASADHDLATGLEALCATLTAEGRPTRAVLTRGPLDVEALARELLLDTDATVVHSLTERRRTALAPAETPDEPAPAALAEGDVVLAPGGLGAAVWPCLVELARRHHGLRIAVLGRGPAEDPGLDPDDEQAVAELRRRLLKETREQGPVRPAEVEARVEGVVRQARRAKALARLRQHAQVRYARVDATDPQALDRVLEDLTRDWRAPAWVVHGTGLQRSRRFEEKMKEEMEAVLAAKLVPVLHLTETLPGAHHVAFGSVAGVLGNPGQADYALANGALTGLMERVGGTVLHWTAWDAAGGMADDESIRTVLEERGLTFLSVEEGTDHFASRAGRPGALLVADIGATDPHQLHASPPTLTVDGEESWLQDHAVSGRPLLPGVRHLQALTEAARARDGAPVEALSTIRFQRPLWVNAPTKVQLVITDLEARTEGPKGVHATARLGPTEGTKPLEPPAPLPDAWTLDQKTLYEHLFHGPSFQVLQGVQVAPGGSVVARADLATGGAAPWALALEACMQAAGAADLHEGAADTALPVGIEEVVRAAPIGRRWARVVARRVAQDPMGSVWDATVFQGGEPVLVVRGLRLQSTGALPRVTDALVELGADQGTVLSARAVPPHEPRNPRAKRGAEHEAGLAAAAAALERAHGRPVELKREQTGRPVPVEAPGGVSITHGHGLALAAADPEREALGIDLERIEPRGEAWAQDVLTEAERSMSLEDQATTRTLLWTLKEATAKALGTGLSVPPRSLEVVELGPGRARIETPEGTLEGRWMVIEGLAVSLVTPDV